MRKLIGNLYWTNRGFGYRVDSYDKARRYNRIALVMVALALVSVVGTIVAIAI